MIYKCCALRGRGVVKRISNLNLAVCRSRMRLQAVRKTQCFSQSTNYEGKEMWHLRSLAS